MLILSIFCQLLLAEWCISYSTSEVGLEWCKNVKTVHSIPDEARTVDIFNYKDKMTPLKEFNEILGALSKKNITNLSIGGNFTTIPENIGLLTKLKHLHITGDQLTTLPQEIGALEGLESLIVMDNKIHTLPEAITKMINLRDLDFSNNKLMVLPENFSALKNLEFLNLQENLGSPLITTEGEWRSIFPNIISIQI